MRKVVIIDYQLGNLFSVRQALHNIGFEVTISNRPDDLKDADAAILPGVGAFGDAMVNLKEHGMDQAIQTFINEGKPFMGVCLGLQLLFSESEEFGTSKGLGVFPGTVKRFNRYNSDGNVVKVPQIAWNEIYPGPLAWNNTPLQGLEANEHMYFVHSFYVQTGAPQYTLSLTQYQDTTYTSSVLKDNVFACQFHPEKSAEKGLRIYKNWAALNNLL